MEKSLSVQSLFTSLQSDLHQLDEERLEAKAAIGRITLIWTPIILGAMGIMIWVTATYETTVGFYVMLFGCIFLWVIYAMKVGAVRKKFAASFKSRLIDKIIRKIDSSFHYAPEQMKYTDSSTAEIITHIQKVKLLPSFHDCWIEDVISGNAGGSPFRFAEMKMDHGSGKNRRTVFKGIMLHVQSRRRFSSPVYVLPQSANRLRDSIWKAMHMTTNRGEVVELGHDEFAKLFKVYAVDPTAPGSILPAAVLSRLVAMHNKITSMNKGHDNVRIAFVEDTITITVALKTNLFEPRIGKPVNDVAFIESNVNYLLLFLGLVEELQAA